jgi:hypothetical protein
LHPQVFAAVLPGSGFSAAPAPVVTWQQLLGELPASPTSGVTPSQQQQQQQQASDSVLLEEASNGLFCQTSSMAVGSGGRVVLCSTDGNVHLMDLQQQQQQQQTPVVDEANELPAASRGGVDGIGGGNSAVALSVRLPGEVFSSPVCLGPWVVLGCRDDYVYCLKHAL